VEELRNFLIKLTVFCFIGAGAGITSIGIPLMNYAKDTRVAHYQVEESIGLIPSEKNCVPKVAKDSLAECKTALYMQKVLTSSKKQLKFWLSVLIWAGITSFIISLSLYIKAALLKKQI
jgi:hypothetical protein